MRRQRVGFFMTLILLLAVGVGMLRGQQLIPDATSSTPTVGTPVAQPSTLVVNQTTLVTVTSQITTTASNPVPREASSCSAWMPRASSSPP